MPEEPPGQREFSVLYRATLAPLRRYLTRLLGNASEAQDVAHDAYMRVYPALADHTAKEPAALLYTAARRLAEAFVPETSASAEPGVEEQVIARQELAILQQAIAELPEGCRAVLLLCKIERLSHREIGQRLDIAVSTVEKQHARALRLLRTALEGRLES